MTRLYTDGDANLLHLQNVSVAVLGYGHVGRPVALNLRDSGVQVVIGNMADNYADEARQDRFTVLPIGNAVRQSQIQILALPDEIMPAIYLEQIAPALKTGDLMIFVSGYTVAFQLIEPPPFVNVGLLAPRAMASRLRQAYLSQVGYPTYIAMHRRNNINAQDRLLAIALALGALRLGALEVSFQQEALLDLFWQQAILPAIHSLLLTASQLLIREGLSEDVVLTELYLSGELGDFFQQAAQQGFVETLQKMSQTGQYGLLSRTERFQESRLQAQMTLIFDAIQSGEFTKEWTSEFTDGYPRLQRLRSKFKQSALWQLEQETLQFLRGD